MDLKKVPTSTLTNELAKREGVIKRIVAPHEEATIAIEGPAISLTIID